jgi:hypothetical protein
VRRPSRRLLIRPSVDRSRPSCDRCTRNERRRLVWGVTGQGETGRLRAWPAVPKDEGLAVTVGRTPTRARRPTSRDVEERGWTGCRQSSTRPLPSFTFFPSPVPLPACPDSRLASRSVISRRRLPSSCPRRPSSQRCARSADLGRRGRHLSPLSRARVLTTSASSHADVAEWSASGSTRQASRAREADPQCASRHRQSTKSEVARPRERSSSRG